MVNTPLEGYWSALVDALRLGLISDDDLRRADPLSLAVESAGIINVDLTGVAIVIAGGVVAGLVLGGCYWACQWTWRWSRRAVERDLEAGGGRGEQGEEVEEIEIEASIGMAAMAGMAGGVAAGRANSHKIVSLSDVESSSEGGSEAPESVADCSEELAKAKIMESDELRLIREAKRNDGYNVPSAGKETGTRKKVRTAEGNRAEVNRAEVNRAEVNPAAKVNSEGMKGEKSQKKRRGIFWQIDCAKGGRKSRGFK